MKPLRNSLFGFLSGGRALFQQSLREAIPDLDRLLAHPAETLGHGDITIGPERNYLWPTLLTLLLVIPLWVGGVVAITLRLQAPGLGPLVWGLVATAPLVIVTFLLLVRLFRGGPCVLSKTGVAFKLGRKTVFCPWALFDTPGRPVPLIAVQRPPDVLAVLPVQSQRCVSVALPLCPQAVSLVEARRDDLVVAQGARAGTWQFKFRSAHEAELRGFAVSADELAALLLHLGRALGPGTGTQEPEVGSRASPAATRDKDGWITVSLTRVTFPSLCCDCGVATASAQAFRAFMPFLQQLTQGQVDLRLPIPVCDACQIVNKRRFRAVFWKTYLVVFGLGVFSGFAVGGILASATGDSFLAGGLAGSFLSGLGSLFIGWFVGRGAAHKAAMPARLERFLPKKGTVAIRFRRPEYAEQVLAANGGSTLKRAAAVGPLYEPRPTKTCD
jgi:hypothetical protein